MMEHLIRRSSINNQPVVTATSKHRPLSPGGPSDDRQMEVLLYHVAKNKEQAVKSYIYVIAR